MMESLLYMVQLEYSCQPGANRLCQLLLTQCIGHSMCIDNRVMRNIAEASQDTEKELQTSHDTEQERMYRNGERE